MVSLLISRIGKVIRDARSVDDVYARLARAAYLSQRARKHRHEVEAAIERELRAYAAAPLIYGDEGWRHVQKMLIEQAYLSWWGRLRGLRLTNR